MFNTLKVWSSDANERHQHTQPVQWPLAGYSTLVEPLQKKSCPWPLFLCVRELAIVGGSEWFGGTVRGEKPLDAFRGKTITRKTKYVDGTCKGLQNICKKKMLHAENSSRIQVREQKRNRRHKKS